MKDMEGVLPSCMGEGEDDVDEEEEDGGEEEWGSLDLRV